MGKRRLRPRLKEELKIGQLWNGLIGLWNGLIGLLAQALLFLYGITGNYGLAIIILTVLMKAFLFPLTIKQVRSMKGMQLVQPKLKELQKKHKDDKQKQQQEMLKLYSEHGVNPFGGCLPMLLQLPMFFALFTVLRQKTPKQIKELATTAPFLAKAGKALMASSFLGISLGKSMSMLVGGGASVLVVLPNAVLMVWMLASQFFQNKFMSTGDQSSKMTMNMMLIFIGYVAYSFPAGLVLYWATSNTVGVIEHYLIERFLPQAKTAN